MMQERVYWVLVRDVDDLRRQLVETRAEFQHCAVEDAIDLWRKRLVACFHAEVRAAKFCTQTEYIKC